MNYLLDTCVISELVARHPRSEVLQWITSVSESDLYLSSITIGEIAKGICKLPDSHRKSDLQKWLDQDLQIRFQSRILSLDVPVMLAWGELMGTLEKQGKKMALMDSLIAATALCHSQIIITRNIQDFQCSGLEIINPWTTEGV